MNLSTHIMMLRGDFLSSDGSGKVKSFRLTLTHKLLEVASAAVKAKERLLRQELRRAVVREVHIKQFEQAERSVAEAVEELLRVQFHDAAKRLKSIGGEKGVKFNPNHDAQGRRVFDPRDWDDTLVDTLFPVLLREAGKAAAAQMLLMGVDVAPKKKGVKFNPYHDEHGRFAPSEFGLTQSSFTTDQAQTTSAVSRLASERVAKNWDVNDSDLRELLAEEGVQLETASGFELRQRAASIFIDKWNSSSGDPISVAVITAVAKSQGRSFDLYNNQKLTNTWIENRPGMHRAVLSFGRAMYETTQTWLSERGINEVEVFRAGSKDDPAASGRVFSSWSLSQGGTRIEGGRIVVKSIIPAKDIMSVPGTGFGTLMESEVVVLPNKNRKYEVLFERSFDRAGIKFTSDCTKSTTASRWLAQNFNYDALDSVEFDTPLGKVDMGFMSEWPDWMKEELVEQARECFNQDFWLGINDTTLEGIDTYIKQGVLDGMSMDEIAEQMRGEGLNEYYHNRGVTIARTETGNLLNGARSASMDRLKEEVPGLQMKKTWMSVLGETTRDSHANLDGVPEGQDGLWALGGVRVPWPAHWLLPVGERVSCQCSLLHGFGLGDEEAEELIEEYNQRLAQQRAARLWLKFNPYHDSQGRFSSGGARANLIADVIEQTKTDGRERSFIVDSNGGVSDIVVGSSWSESSEAEVDTPHHPDLYKEGARLELVHTHPINEGYTGLSAGDLANLYNYPGRSTITAVDLHGNEFSVSRVKDDPDSLRRLWIRQRDIAGEESLKITDRLIEDKISREQAREEMRRVPLKIMERLKKEGLVTYSTRIKSFFLSEKFNPHHDSLGRFSSGSGIAHTELSSAGKAESSAQDISSKVKSTKPLNGGVNAVHIFKYEDEDGNEKRGVFKSMIGENPRVHPAFLGRQSINEVAASVVDEEMGLGLVAKTEMVLFEGRVGSLSDFINDTAKLALDSRDTPFSEVKRFNDMCYYDVIIGNTDRHLGNWLIKNGEVRLIDNGMSFARNSDYEDPLLRFRAIEAGERKDAMQTMSPRFREGLSRLQSRKEEVTTRLRSVGVDDARIDSFWKRVDYVQRAGRIGFGESTLRDIAILSEGGELF